MKDEELTRLLRLGGETEAGPSGGCLDDVGLAALLDGGLGAEEAAGARAHLARCAVCRARVGLLARLEDGDPPRPGSELLARVRRLPDRGQGAPRPRRWRWAVPAAAAAVLAVVAITIGREDTMQTTHFTETDVRGLELLERPQILAPRKGEVLAAASLDGLELRWTAVPGAVFYDVKLVSADGVRIWDGRSETDRLTLPAGLLATSGQELYLWVRAVLPGGKRLQSEIVGFRLGEGGAPGG